MGRISYSVQKTLRIQRIQKTTIYKEENTGNKAFAQSAMLFLLLSFIYNVGTYFFVHFFVCDMNAKVTLPQMCQSNLIHLHKTHTPERK